MSFFEWKDAYSVGVPKIDEQHKVLVALINELDKIQNQGGELHRVLETLDWYVKEHFSDEEKLMRDASYGELKSHIAEHREFETWLKNIRFYMRSAGAQTEQAAREMEDHLKEWLTKHILVVDMSYKDVLAPH
ncbi:MAG: bacteriohemerythrin [Magnetospiraceae bacterium]